MDQIHSYTQRPVHPEVVRATLLAEGSKGGGGGKKSKSKKGAAKKK
jgi:hypothetical protein